MIMSTAAIQSSYIPSGKSAPSCCNSMMIPFSAGFWNFPCIDTSNTLGRTLAAIRQAAILEGLQTQSNEEILNEIRQLRSRET